MELPSISNILSLERILPDLLLIELEEEHLILGAGRARWLPSTTQEHERRRLQPSLVDFHR